MHGYTVKSYIIKMWRKFLNFRVNNKGVFNELDSKDSTEQCAIGTQMYTDTVDVISQLSMFHSNTIAVTKHWQQLL